MPQVQRALHAFCYDGSVGEAWTRDIPHTPQKLLKTSLEKSLYASDFHDVRITGRLSGPRSFSDKMSIHDSFRTHFSGSKRIWKRSEDAHSIEICVDVFLQGETGSRSVHTFDLTSFAPRTLRTSAIRGSGERPESRETFEWESINGVYVPIAVHGERIRARRDQGKMIEWTSTYELKFGRRSVNKGIDATLNVKPQVLNQTETLMKLVAPREQADDLTKLSDL